MNNKNLMVARGSDMIVDLNTDMNKDKQDDEMFVNSVNAVNNGLMMRRDDVLGDNKNIGNIVLAGDDKKDDIEAPEKQLFFDEDISNVGNNKDDKNGKLNAVNNIINNSVDNVKTGVGVNNNHDEAVAKTKENIAKIANKAATAAKQEITTEQQQKAQNKNSDNKNNTDNKNPEPAKIQIIDKIKTTISPETLAKAYVDLFKEHLGLELSVMLCYENMRKLCEPNIKDPLNTVYFIENTYRLSTLLYLTGNFPIVVMATILAEKNRKNVLKYVTTEVENGAKSFDVIRDLRFSRYKRKYENMNANDSITITPGVTMFTSELINMIKTRFNDICIKAKKFDKSFAKSIKALDDSALHDVTFIYSNCWYFLQGFENVQEMRSYVMSITDDTRKNLKI